MQNTTTETKRIWQSKTILALIPIIVSAVLGGEIQDEQLREITGAVSTVLTVVGVVIGRFTAKKSVSL